MAHKNNKKKNFLSTLRYIVPLAVIFLLGALYISQTSCSSPSGNLNQTSIEPNTQLMGVKTKSNTPSNLIHYKAMDVSFNPECHIPNWVSWELTGEETTGGNPRANKFHSDPSIAGCAEPYDYNYSGYDRGHMAPAGDMKWDPIAMAESFSMTNICPQAKDLNTGAWRTLEEKCRSWAVADNRIIIVCGPVIDGKPVEYIGETQVYVPQSFFKVVLAPDAKPPRAIAFLMNNGHVDGGMQKAVTTVDEIEKLTGHDFFSSLPDEIENEVESHSDFLAWPHTRVKNESSK